MKVMQRALAANLTIAVTTTAREVEQTLEIGKVTIEGISSTAGTIVDNMTKPLQGTRFQ